VISQTVAARAAEEIRQRILTLQPGFLPGNRLFPQRISNDLGISSTPVRDALTLLASEGLLEISPRRGVTVIRLSETDLQDLAQVRSGLEMLAVRFRHDRLTNAEAQNLDAALDACEMAIESNDFSAWRAQDDEFHRLLVATSRSTRLIGLYESVLRQSEILLIYNPEFPNIPRESLEEHRALVRLLREGQLRRLEKAVTAHWENSMARMRAKYNQFMSEADAGDGARDSVAGPLASRSISVQVHQVDGRARRV
jgi:DNA-binding GntR family transcriptional regulator